MTTLSPGHKPPQVTMQAFTSLGSKNRFLLGPALKNFFADSIASEGPKVALAE